MTPALIRVVLASRNAGKLAEVRAILGDGFDVVDLGAFPKLALPPEDGATYEENALGKARAVVRALGIAALADDSGLEVDALDGAPGVHSNRYAGEEGDAEANTAKLLAVLAGVPPERRRARFVCVAALIAPNGREWVAGGEVCGIIVEGRRGAGGFGYDPVFVPDGFRRTFAEMTAAEKNALSHRNQAFRSLAPCVRELPCLSGGSVI
jgi:XTP/dITP diphosphohydrolase